MMEEFCERWGIVHRVATAYHPRANKIYEVGVKSVKPLIRGNTSKTSKQDNFPVEASIFHPSREVTSLQFKIRQETILANGPNLEWSLKLGHTIATMSVRMVPVQLQRGNANT